MTSFICLECNYRFESKFFQAGKKCPYCGKERVVKEPDADELLEED